MSQNLSKGAKVVVVLPEREDDMLSTMLRKLTQTLSARGLETGMGLGGEYGYGCVYEDDVIQMHPYCWCEQDDCPWCGGDASPWAQNKGLGGDMTSRAPNFWHKPSGLRVWWYKYIGRGMEVDPGSSKEPWRTVLEENDRIKERPL